MNPLSLCLPPYEDWTLCRAGSSNSSYMHTIGLNREIIFNVQLANYLLAVSDIRTVWCKL